MIWRIVPALAAFAGASLAAVRARNEFRFTLDISYDVAAPLFGALAEQKWDSGWKPQFLFPVPAADQEGAVFRVPHGGHSATWVLTDFDLAAGHVQYVYVLDGLLLTRIDIHMRKAAPRQTEVTVLYERTSLSSAADDHVRELSRNDAAQGPQWKAAIEKSVAPSR